MHVATVCFLLWVGARAFLSLEEAGMAFLSEFSACRRTPGLSLVKDPTVVLTVSENKMLPRSITDTVVQSR
jgi:hypothetical protein